ncbi:MAG: FAD-dependent oxidoreductase [Bacillus subtilis]|nr:FAD-dependent oxidoreductase [Bacillus subtilis]
MKAVKNGDFNAAKALWDKTSNLPELCGALCQQEVMCEGACTLNKIKKPVKIGEVERGLALLFWGETDLPETTTDHTHLVVGMGPAGLANAIAMARMGYQVDAVDANPRIGGATWNLVPPFRFDATDLSSIEVKLAKLGVRVTNFLVGRDAALADLIDQYDSVFIAHGLDVPQAVPGFLGPDVFYEGIDPLNRVRHSPVALDRLVGKRVVVVGLGSVACDTARTFARLGRDVQTVYRRTLAEAPPAPRRSPRRSPKASGSTWAPKSQIVFRGILRCERTELVRDDACRADVIVAVPGADVDIACDTVVFAVGQVFSDAVFAGTGSSRGRDLSPYATSDPKVFVGGDRIIKEKSDRRRDVVSGMEAARLDPGGMHMRFTVRKTILYVFGLLLLGLTVSLMLSTNLGMSSWDAFFKNLHDGIPLDYRYLNSIAAAVLTPLGYLAQKKKFTWWVLFPIMISFFIGAEIDLIMAYGILPNVAAAGWIYNWLYLLLAIATCAVGLNIIAWCDYPMPALDELCLALSAIFRTTHGKGKLLGELLALVLAVLSGPRLPVLERVLQHRHHHARLRGRDRTVDRPDQKAHATHPGGAQPTKIEIFGDGLERSQIKDQPRRTACRGVIVKDGRILVVHSPKLDIYTLPGGGREDGEALAHCVEREVAEETGVVVKAGPEACVVIEYFTDSIWESLFPVRADRRDAVPVALTEEERKTGCVASWMDLYDFLALLETYESTNPYGANILERELVGLMNTI